MSTASPSFSRSASTTDRGSRTARLLPHFATCIGTSRIYISYDVYPDEVKCLRMEFDNASAVIALATAAPINLKLDEIEFIGGDGVSPASFSIPYVQFNGFVQFDGLYA